MYRSTTPTIILNVKNEDFDMSLIDVCHVGIKSESGTVKQIYENPIIDVENKRIVITLSQEDTLRFYVGKVKIQVKAKLKNGSVISSKILKIDIKEILEEEVL